MPGHAIVGRMIALARRQVAIDPHVDCALPGTEGYDDAPIRADRHETRRHEQLDGQDEQRQCGKEAARGAGMSDRPRHVGAAIMTRRCLVTRAIGPARVALNSP